MKYSYLKRILNIPHGGYYANSLHMSIRIISRCILVLAGISLMFASGEARAATATGTPDLAVTASTLSFTGKNLKAGEKTTLKASIKNIGTQKAANVIVRFFVDGGKVYEKKVATLGKGAKSTVTYAYAIPAAAQGAFVFSVSLDPDNSIAELDEANNTAQISVPVIKATRNLVLSSLKPSNAKPKPGQKITWQLKIKNGGSVKETNVKAALYADMHSLDPTAQVVITSINPGSSVTKNLSWTVPEHLDPAIGYMVRAEADPDNAVPETSETDNVKSYSLSLTVPDISITADAGTLPNSFVYPGTFSQLFVRVKNDNVAALTNVKVAVYYALGSKSAVRTKLAETILKLPKKANVPYMFDRVFLPGSAGAGSLAYLFVVADPENAIAESNKSNNELVLQRSVVERPAQAQCPCINVAVHDEDGNPMAATVQMVRIPYAPVIKTAGADAIVHNAAGLVVFEQVPQNAQVTLTVSKAGWRTQTATFAYDKNNDETVYRSFNMDKQAVLAGTVKNPAGAALQWVTVKLEGTGMEVVTDAQGRYGFALNGGAHALRFTKPGYARIVENVQVASLDNITLNKTMSSASVAYVSAVITNDDGVGLGNVDIYLNGTMIGTTAADGHFVFNNMTAGTKIFKFKKPGYVETQFTQTVQVGEEYDLSFTMFKPSSEGHAERGTEIVSWHQHEETPANAYFIPQYQVDVWWGVGRVKMGLDYVKDGSGAKLSKLVIANQGLDWECNKVEGEGSVETSAIDIPITIAAGSCSGKKTQMDVYKVAIESNGQEVWSDSSFWTTASDPSNLGTKTFDLGNMSVEWNNNFKVKMWVRVQKKSVVGTDGDGAGALAGYHLDKKLVTWYPQRPPTTVITTSWGQVGGYLLGILDNPVTAITSFTDLYSVERFNQYAMEEVLPQNFPGAPPSN